VYRGATYIELPKFNLGSHDHVYRGAHYMA